LWSARISHTQLTFLLDIVERGHFPFRGEVVDATRESTQLFGGALPAVPDMCTGPILVKLEAVADGL
jgi:hypothetical protein